MLDRAYGTLIGSAIGDGMGMPASFMTPDQIKKILWENCRIQQTVIRTDSTWFIK
ncbi:hypothetical protein CcarbDRAFT_3002 [Clostridium carboxidivorans P7]|uniref:ADP-ribosylglycohydrolase n=1 Tax=Clostridium carboxidivorans P7 TaxID=536227 RepID=C6PW35_9CLOT|nr:hypothetical protein [Clostridium carboxidivorans]EET86514.1 hypothetical protein CcarbDRAFT_3002 [Clostridium carboxidivorans P7]